MRLWTRLYGNKFILPQVVLFVPLLPIGTRTNNVFCLAAPPPPPPTYTHMVWEC